MTNDTKNALLAFVGAIRKEVDRGHIPDETGSIGATADDLVKALENENTEPAAAWNCDPVKYEPGH